MKLLLTAAFCAIATAAIPIVAAASSYTVVKNWSDGPIAVQQQLLEDGRQVCHFEQRGEKAEFGLSQTHDGTIGATLTIHDTWSRGENVTMTIDGRKAFAGIGEVFNDRHSLWIPLQNEGGGRDLLRDLSNGRQLVVSAGPTATTFPLPGTASAILVLHRCADAIVVAQKTAPIPAPLPERAQGSVQLSVYHGTYTIPGVVLNGVRKASFILDSGAASLVVPASCLAEMLTKGEISQTDFIGMLTFIIADGSRHRSPVYRLHTVTIAGVTLHEVAVSSGSDEGTWLMGQTVLGRLGSWSIDNHTATLTVHR
jgi:hypothetical protein